MVWQVGQASKNTMEGEVWRGSRGTVQVSEIQLGVVVVLIEWIDSSQEKSRGQERQAGRQASERYITFFKVTGRQPT